MKVTFLISHKPILILNVDMTTKMVQTEYCDDERVVDPIITPMERTYVGLTRRLRFFMSDTSEQRSLSELVNDIQKNGIAVPWQYNLDIRIDT